MWRADSLEKTLMLRKTEGRRRSGWQRTRWLDGIIEWTWVWASPRRWWKTEKPGALQFMKSPGVGHNWRDWVTKQCHAMLCYAMLSRFSRVWLCVTPWTVAYNFSLHGIFQARVLGWVAISFSRGSSWPRDWTQVFCLAGRRFTVWATRGVPLKCNTLIQILTGSWTKNKIIVLEVRDLELRCWQGCILSRSLGSWGKNLYLCL